MGEIKENEPIPSWARKIAEEMARKLGIDPQTYWNDRDHYGRVLASRKAAAKKRLLFGGKEREEWLDPERLGDSSLPDQSFSIEIVGEGSPKK